MTCARTLSVISLGCPKNLVDTEEFLAGLHRAGFMLTSNLFEAEVIIVNTCAFISEATRESVETLLEAARFKKEGRCRLLVAAGCLSQRARGRLLKLIPEIDLVVGVHSYGRLPDLIHLSLKKNIRLAILKPYRKDLYKPPDRYLTRPAFSVYLKISEGCDHRCSYCIIPRLRGTQRSRPLETIIQEAAMLAEKGARELNLVAQDTTRYGNDRGNEARLPQLLKRLTEVEGIEWIRLLYAHPAHLDEETIEIVASHPKVCSYIDLPLQHINDRILRAMGRSYTRARAVNLVEKLKKRGIILRTTFMVGFPGEGKKEFAELLAFMESYPLDRVGAFTYSPQRGTPAFTMKGGVKSEVRKERWNMLMEKQQKISYRLNRRFLGKIIDVLVEGENEPGVSGYFRGRSFSQAPEIDGSVLFVSPFQPAAGQIVKVLVDSCGPYDLFGKEVK